MGASNFFILSDGERGSKLLSYSGITKASKLVLTLKVEVSGYDMAHTLEQLEAIQRANNAKPTAPKAQPAAKKKAIGQATVLALPAPDRGRTHE